MTSYLTTEPDLAVDSFRQHARAVIATDILPLVGEWERTQVLPRAAYIAFARGGLVGLMVRQEFGGLGLSMRHAGALTEELMEHSLLGVLTSLVAQSHSVLPLLDELGTESQRDNYLAPALQGRSVCGIAITEPAGGSDLIGAIGTHAVEEEDCWVLNGQKLFITNGPVADFLLVLCRTELARGPLGMTMFIVDTASAGFKVKLKLEKTGLHCSPTGWLEFADCRVPKTAVLGPVNGGYACATSKLVDERILASVAALASARTVIRAASRLTRREPWSRRQPLARLLAEVEAGFAFVYQTIDRRSEDFRRYSADASAAKFVAAELAQHVIKRCMEVAGPESFLSEPAMYRAFRDIRVMGIFAGSSETMRDVYSVSLIGSRRSKRTPC